MLLNYRVVKDNNDIEKTDLDKIREITIALEKELYFKNQFKTNPKNLYQQDAKTLLQFLRKDKNGSITVNLMSHVFPIKKAAELR